jgi:hypothetical protein
LISAEQLAMQSAAAASASISGVGGAGVEFVVGQICEVFQKDVLQAGKTLSCVQLFHPVET